MSKFTGLFGCFSQIDNLKIENIASLLHFKGDLQILGNRMGNQILYPQMVPFSSEELQFNLALFQEALRVSGEKFYNPHLKRIYLLEDFLNWFPDLSKLIPIFVNVLAPQGIVTLVLRTEHLGMKNLGTLLKPQITQGTGLINLWISEKKYQIKIGSLIAIPAASEKVDIKFESSQAKLEGKDSLAVEVAGGQLGLMIDARR